MRKNRVLSSAGMNGRFLPFAASGAGGAAAVSAEAAAASSPGEEDVVVAGVAETLVVTIRARVAGVLSVLLLDLTRRRMSLLLFLTRQARWEEVEGRGHDATDAADCVAAERAEAALLRRGCARTTPPLRDAIMATPPVGTDMVISRARWNDLKNAPIFSATTFFGGTKKIIS
jgi:hypothetical protein